MAKGFGIILGVVAVTLVATLVKKGQAATKLEFYPEGLDVSKISLQNLKPTLKVRIVNPRDVQQNIEAVFLNVWSDDKQIGRVQITEPFKIPALADTVIGIPVTILPTAAVSVLAAVIRNKGKLPGVELKGSVQSMGIAIPINVTLA